LGKVKKLDEAVFKKIAAGEVVERPLSVVKELVENSLDAGANNIEIELFDAGKSKIIIRDNGDGFDPSDIEQAFKRHSTSKFKELSDFDSLNTLGFRGEALPSILEVSIVELKTSNNNNGNGIFIIFDGNKVENRKEIAFNKGSEITVKELFYNFPVRKKFLKTDRTELNRIISFAEQSAIVNYNVKFKLINNNKIIFEYNRVNNLKERVYQIFGKNFTNSLKELNYTMGKYKVGGLVSDINYGGATKKKQFFFVNDRIVREKTIIASFNNSFRRYLEKGKFPEGVILLNVPASEIDVNIHPMKLDIKFRDSGFIYNFIKHSIESCFDFQSENSPDNFPNKVVFDKQLFFNNSNNSRETEYSIRQEIKSNDEQEPVQHSLFNNKSINSDDFKLIGQYIDSYILIEKGDNLVLVDQHNAHERHNFDRLKAHYKNNEIESSLPLFPIIMEFSERELSLLKDKAKLLSKTGFQLTEYSGNSFNIKKFPSIMNERDIRDAIYKILYLKGDQTDVEDKIFAEIACKSAIKINHPLQPEEMKIIVRNLFKSSNPYFCPHGRPIIINFTLEYIEKKLKRR